MEIALAAAVPLGILIGRALPEVPWVEAILSLGRLGAAQGHRGVQDRPGYTTSSARRSPT